MRWVAVSLLLLSACGTRISFESPPANTEAPTASSPTPLPDVVLRPPAYVTPTPSPEASAGDNSGETPMPTPLPGESPEPPVDISTRAETTVNGQLYDILGQPVEGEVTLQTLQGTAVQKTNLTRGGIYVFNAIPAGVPIRLTASAPGYAAFSQTVVLKSNTVGDPSANRIPFGGENNAQSALLAGPQLTQISPDRARAFEAQDKLAFGLRFDRPVDRQSIQQSLSVITRQTLSLNGFSLPANAVLLPAERMHWEWQADSTFATVYLPLLPGTSQPLALALQFTKPFQSQTGDSSLLTSTEKVPFRLNGVLQTASAFHINPDTQALRLLALNYQKPQVQLHFNKPLAFVLGEQGHLTVSKDLLETTHYTLAIDSTGNGRFETLKPALRVQVQQDRLSLDFGDLSAFSNRSARLVFAQNFTPQDFANNALETPLSASFPL